MVSVGVGQMVGVRVGASLGVTVGVQAGGSDIGGRTSMGDGVVRGVLGFGKHADKAPKMRPVRRRRVAGKDASLLRTTKAA